MARPPRGLADTSIWIAKESGRPIDSSKLPVEIAASMITIGELRAGVLAAQDTGTRDRRLSTLIAVLALDPVPVDAAVTESWAGLRIALRDGGLRMPVNDSWIAATAMSLGVPLVTQDEDHLDVPGLEVIRV